MIRAALPADLEGLIKMSKSIWEGSDYLPKVAAKWIEEGGFFVADYNGRIIGCTKISIFPHEVIWFEGLRVQSRFQGKGIGRLLNAFAYQVAMAISKGMKQPKYEFCTYYKNHESIHLAQKLGFEVLERYYVLYRRGVQKTTNPAWIQDFSMDAFACYPSHIPCGWRSVYNDPLSLPWLKSNCRIFETPSGKYLAGGISHPSILPLGRPVESLRSELPYFQALYGSRKSMELIVPASWEQQIPALMQEGFKFWDDEIVPALLIFGRA